MTRRTCYRTCPLCEATCGLEIELDGTEVRRIRGDQLDVFSAGFLCPKGPALKQLHEDPDRLRQPLVRTRHGLVAASWDAAFDEVDSLLTSFTERHGRQALAVYAGNPNSHNLGALLYNRPLLKALGTRNLATASTVDQRPKEISSALMFGTQVTLPVPDLDRTQLLVIIGANPLESNGSIATAPDWPGRLRAIRHRGGRVVVADPKRTKTADAANQHLPIRPGADPYLLMALAHTLFAEDQVNLGRLAEFTTGVDAVRAASRPFSPEAVSGVCGLAASTIRSLATELADAPCAVVYGRIGTCTQEFGTIASWLIDVLNVLTGNLDRPGGAMFPTPATGSANTRGRPGVGRGVRLGRWHTRVRGVPDSLGELPASCLAEEIDTPGEGQLRGLITLAGNPVLSTPNGPRLAAALPHLELMVSVDFYLNETTRHAQVLLPPPSPLQKSHLDVAFAQFSVRNVIHYSPPVLPLDGGLDEWEILARLTLIAEGHGPRAEVADLDDRVIGDLVRHAVVDPDSPLYGCVPEELLAQLAVRRGPERLVDFLLRSGPYHLTLDEVAASEHGVDLGALQPRVPEVLRTPSGKIDLAPQPILDDVRRLAMGLANAPHHPLVLIGRRHLRSNNSWMHNLLPLVRGAARCTLEIHPDDAHRGGIEDGALVCVSASGRSVEVPAAITPAIRPGVVSLPHGWGHSDADARLAVAAAHAGASFNALLDGAQLDPLSGNAVLNGIPVSVTPVG